MGNSVNSGLGAQRALDAGQNEGVSNKDAQAAPIERHADPNKVGTDKFVSNTSGQNAALQYKQAAQVKTPNGVQPPSPVTATKIAQSDRPIVMRVFSNDPTLPAVKYEIPRAAFTLVDGKPTGLVGERLEVLTPDKIGGEFMISDEITKALTPKGENLSDSVFWLQMLEVRNAVDNIAERVRPDANGDFLVDADGEAIAQTTAFLGAYEAITLAEKAAGGMRIPWGAEGKLGIIPYAYVTTHKNELNAVSFHGGRRNIEFGTFGRIEGDHLVPHSGMANIPLLDKERQNLIQLESASIPDQKQIALTRGRIEKLEALAGKSGTVDIAPVLIEMAKSREVVAHEAFHSVLSTLKPGLGVYHIGQTFHEAFSDTGSFLTALNHPDILELMLKETGGDLSQPNVASRIGEQCASFLAQTDPKYTDPKAVRDYANPLTLENFAPVTTTARSLREIFKNGALERVEKSESLGRHSLSRLISGSLYDVYVDMFEAHKRLLGVDSFDGEAGQKLFDQIAISARDDLAGLVMRAIPYLPESSPNLLDVSRAFIMADAEHFSSKNRDRLTDIFTARGMLDVAVPQLLADKPTGNIPTGALDEASILAAIPKAVWIALGRKETEPMTAWKVLPPMVTQDGYRTIRLIAPEAQLGASSTEHSLQRGILGAATPSKQSSGVDLTLNKVPQSICPGCSMFDLKKEKIALYRYRSIVVDPQGKIIDVHGLNLPKSYE